MTDVPFSMGRRPTPPVRSLRAVAELARAGQHGVGTRSHQVRFEVHHVRDRPGYYRQMVTGHDAADTERFEYVETLTSASNGVGLIVGTSIGDRPDMVRVEGDGFPEAHVVADEPDLRLFRGHAQPNPTFLYEASTVVEGLISVELEPRATSWGHGVALAQLGHEVARLAAHDAGSPLLSLQCPAQVPAAYRHDHRAGPASTEDWARSSALAVRFTIGVGDTSAEERMGYYWTLQDYCAARGFGLWVSDSRPNHRAGNWFQLLKHDTERARAHVAGLVHRAGRPVRWVVPVTLVGPARVGSSLATFELLSTFTPLSIAATSQTAIDDLAFIHLLVAVPAESEERYRYLAGRLGQALARPPREPLSRAFQDYLGALGIAMKPDGSAAAEARFITLAAGYKLLVGPCLPAVPPPEAPGRSLWLAWEAGSRRAALNPPIIALYRVLDGMAEEAIALAGTGEAGAGDGARLAALARLYPNLEYLISRDTGEGSVRAKAKLAVPDALVEARWPTAGPAQRGASFSALLEERWLDELESAGAIPREVTVAWREHWLGRWSSLAN